MLELDDGSIFGRVEKEIIIPEKIIPEHNKIIYVEWNDWEDYFEDDEDGER